MDDLYHNAELLGNSLLQRKLTICTAESCSGGGIAYALTAVPGSSAWFSYGWVTYSNEAKQALLGVPHELFEKHGAVSEEVVNAMALGALQRAQADICVSVSGIAGPSGGTPEKPVGTVCFGFATPTLTKVERLLFKGDRESIRHQTIIHALQECNRLVQSSFT
jgi:nicotinamide-nucleotide amidase